MVYLADANLFLRFLLNDVADQFEEVKKYFQEAKNGSIKIIVPPIVFAEIIYVSESGYGLPREKIVEAVGSLLNMPFLNFEEVEVLRSALVLFAKNKLDFTDCYLQSRCELDRVELLTFDKKLSKI